MTPDQHMLLNWMYDNYYLDISYVGRTLYDFGGMSTVIDHMEKYHPEVEWGRCEDCDNNDIPLTNLDWSEIMVCLVCGSTDVSIAGQQLALF